MNLKLSKVLTIAGTAIAALAIFFFFAAGLKHSYMGVSHTISIFDLMFGKGNAREIGKIAGLIVVFVLEILVIVLAAVIVVGLLTEKIPTKGIVVLIIIDCALILTCVILSFCTKSMCIAKILKDVTEEYRELYKKELQEMLKLGTGAILYSIAGIIGLGGCVGGLISLKLGK